MTAQGAISCNVRLTFPLFLPVGVRNTHSHLSLTPPRIIIAPHITVYIDSIVLHA